MLQRDWVDWHRDYDDPGSLLTRRLELVQGHMRAELDRAPAGDIRLISLCAGQGRDVIGVLAGHPRRDGVGARLIELDERNVAEARETARAAGLEVGGPIGQPRPQVLAVRPRAEVASSAAHNGFRR